MNESGRPGVNADVHSVYLVVGFGVVIQGQNVVQEDVKL